MFVFYHPIFIFVFLFLVNSLPSAEIASKRGRQIKIKLVSITALSNNLSPRCKNAQQYLDNTFSTNFFIVLLSSGDIRWFVHKQLSFTLHFISSSSSFF